jgi:hypothetical protein
MPSPFPSPRRARGRRRDRPSGSRTWTRPAVDLLIAWVAASVRCSTSPSSSVALIVGPRWSSSPARGRSGLADALVDRGKPRIDAGDEPLEACVDLGRRKASPERDEHAGNTNGTVKPQRLPQS